MLHSKCSKSESAMMLQDDSWYFMVHDQIIVRGRDHKQCGALHRASTAAGHLCTSASSSKQLCGYATTAIQQLANPLLAQLQLPTASAPASEKHSSFKG